MTGKPDSLLKVMIKNIHYVLLLNTDLTQENEENYP